MLDKLQILLVAAGAIAAAACTTAGPRVGQSAIVRFGTVQDAEQVALDSTAAQGALVGGTLGLIAGRGRSSFGNALAGATIGGAVGAAAEGQRTGMSYTVAMQDGSSVRIVTDQREIRPGDCVAIEQVGSTANIRRATGYCDSANREAVASVASTARSDALACGDAKRKLADADTEAARDLAIRKVQLLCNS